jgi:predicted metal-dependent phosphoesterase TrpH
MNSDTHIHSDATDGSLTVEEIVAQAKGSSLEVISITDHDTTRGQDDNQRIANSVGLGYIKGIEISAYDSAERVQVHILGYAYQNDELLEQFCAGVNVRRKAAGIQMVERLIEHGYNFTVEDVLKYARGGIIYRQHIMHTLFARGLVGGMFGEVYKELFSAEGLAYFPFEYVDACEAVSLVQEAGGLAVVAHPAEYNNWEVIPRLVDAGLQGLELNHPAHTSEDVAALSGVAREYRLFTTSGSDFHGMYAKKPVPIGYGSSPISPQLLELAVGL